MTATPARTQARDDGREQADRYRLLRVATLRHQCDPARLEPDELAQAHRQAEQSLALEALVLASREALGVLVSDDEIASGLATIAGRYGDAAAPSSSPGWPSANGPPPRADSRPRGAGEKARRRRLRASLWRLWRPRSSVGAEPDAR